MDTEPNSWMAQEIFKILTGMGHEILMFDGKGKRVFDAEKASMIYSVPAAMMIQLGYTGGRPAKPVVKFYASKTTDPALVDQCKRTLRSHNLFDHSFDVHVFGRTIEPKHFSKILPPVEESWHNTPEMRLLESWYDQFRPELILEGHEQTRKQVHAAVEETGSKDPRTVLQNLQDNHAYWRHRFTKDPKTTLDTIRRVLAEID
jgi:hypothetical protein